MNVEGFNQKECPLLQYPSAMCIQSCRADQGHREPHQDCLLGLRWLSEASSIMKVDICSWYRYVVPLGSNTSTWSRVLEWPTSRHFEWCWLNWDIDHVDTPSPSDQFRRNPSSEICVAHLQQLYDWLYMNPINTSSCMSNCSGLSIITVTNHFGLIPWCSWCTMVNPWWDLFRLHFFTERFNLCGRKE